MPIYASAAAAWRCSAMQLGGRTRRGPRMAGLLPFSAPAPGRLQLGYRQARAPCRRPAGRQGGSLCGHEFHRWELQPSGPQAARGRSQRLLAAREGAGAGRNGRRLESRPNLHGSLLAPRTWSGAPRSASPGGRRPPPQPLPPPMRQPEVRHAVRFFTNRPLTDLPTNTPRRSVVVTPGAPPGPARAPHRHYRSGLVEPDGETRPAPWLSVLSSPQLRAVLCSRLLRARQTCELAGVARRPALPCGGSAAMGLRRLGDFPPQKPPPKNPAEIRQQIPVLGVPGAMVCPGGEVWPR